MRINILHCLDSLCEASVHYQLGENAGSGSKKPSSYVEYVSRDLEKIVQLVVPNSRDGLVNLASARQILESWRAKRVLDPGVVEGIVKMLDEQRESVHEQPSEGSSSTTNASEFSKNEILQRFEEDRERHKLLRQKRWVLPIPTSNVPPQPKLASVLLANSAQTPPSQNQTITPELALDIEFENAWETTSDFNEDDEELIREENVLCFPDDIAGIPMEIA